MTYLKCYNKYTACEKNIIIIKAGGLMKNIANLVIALLVLLNQVPFSLPASSSITSDSQSTPSATVSTPLTDPTPITTTAPVYEAYPPPVAETPVVSTATPSPTSTETPTTSPIAPTPTTTNQPTTVPTQEDSTLPPSIELRKDTSTYTPGEIVDLTWKLANTKSTSINPNWRVEILLPKGWSPADVSKDGFTTEKQQLNIVPQAFSDTVSLHTTEDSGDQEILATFYDNDVFVYQTSIFLRARTSAMISPEGGEIEGKAGNSNVKVIFPKGALPTDSVISMQTPEEYPDTLPLGGNRVIELLAENPKEGQFHKFDTTIQLEISYDPEELGIHPSRLALYWYDESVGAWRIVPGHAEEDANTYVAYTDHFSLYSLGQNDWESRKIPPLDVAQVSEFTGAVSYSIPLEVPQGPGGIQPSISLDYNSMSMEGFYFQSSTNLVPGKQPDVVVGAQGSWVGAGWSLNAGGSILRNMGADIDWDGDDTFSLVVGGTSMKLVPVSSGSGYIDYKASDENFWKIRRITNRNNYGSSPPYLSYGVYGEENDTWIAWDKTGNRYTFGKRANYIEFYKDDAKYVPNGAGHDPNYYNCAEHNRECIIRPWGWFLTEIKYPSGQSLTLTYATDLDEKCFWYIGGSSTCDGGRLVDQAVYPAEIRYPDGKTKIVFTLENRPDYIYYWGDSETKNRYEKRRLSSIRVVVNTTITREYKLNYFTNSENPLLPGSKWTPCDPNRPSGDCFNPGLFGKNSQRLSSLKSVAQYGLGGVAGGNKLPDITFAYANQMFLTEVNNGQGGKASFTYEAIDPNANGGDGSPFTAAGGDPDQKKNLYQSSGFTLAVSEVNYINPSPNTWTTANGLPVRPGQGYRLTCTVRNANGQVQFGVYYSNEDSGAKTYSRLVDVTSTGGVYEANVVIPANANRATPLIRYTTENTPGSRITVTNCSGIPVLTHYRATQRTLSDTTTDASYTFTYAYEGAATNDAEHSAYATLGANRRSGASVPYTEFRGHAKVIVAYPNGLRTETSFYQDDVNKGRSFDTRQYDGSLLLNRTITHWIDTPVVISDGQVSNICAKKTKSEACFLDQKVAWSFSDWDESRDYGQGVIDENADAYIGLHRVYQYATQAPYGYGNLQSVTEQSRPGSEWVSYRLTRNAYSFNVVDGGTNPDSTKYLVGLPGAVSLYQCSNGICDETLPNLVKSTCNIYDDPINGGSGICSLYQDGSNKVEIIDAPDTGLLTGFRTLLRFGGGSTPDYTAPYYSDTTFRYDSKGNRIRTTQYTGEGSKTSLATTGAQVTEACFGVGNQPAGCQDDGYYAYPRWEKNALEQVTSWEIDYSLGVPTRETDSNGAVIYAVYDPFGRMTALVRPGDGSNSPTISAAYHDGAPSWIEVTPKNGTASRKIYDGLGRLIQTQQGNVLLATGTRDVVVDLAYDFQSQVTWQSVPVDIAPYDGGGLVFRPQTGNAGTANAYDLLGRLTTVIASDGTQKTFDYGVETTQAIQKVSENRYQPASEWLSFVQTTETVTRDGQAVQLVNRAYQNVWGQTVAVQSALPPYVYYRYDPAGDLLDALSWDGTTFFTEDGQEYAQGNATSIGYDLGGRKVSMVDADMGSWGYAYDAIGNLIRQVDAKSQATCLYYDALNRVTGKNYQGDTACPGDPGSGYAVAFTYDLSNASNSGIGRRTGMSDASGSTLWEYDLRGRVIHEAKTVLDKEDGNKDLGTYHSYWSYNSDDSIRQMVYPNGETVNYGYTPQGSISQVYSIQDATDASQFYVSASGYNAAGQAVSRTLGNGIEQAFTYYPWTQQGGRLQNLSAQAGEGATYQDLSLGYDEVGNITQLDDDVANETLNFTYDNLNRLDLASGAYSEDPDYSVLNGNISARNGITYTYGDAAHAHAVTSTSDGRSFVYDANGNMTSRAIPGGTYTLGYDAENQVASINGAETNARYVYDGDGKRVLAIVDGVRTVYIGGYFEAELDATATCPVEVPLMENDPWKVYLPAVMSDGEGSGGMGMGAGNFGNTVYHTHPAATGQDGITWRIYYSAGGARIAIREQGNSAAYDLHYFLTDYLNSTTKTVKQDGTVSEVRYSAWGETRLMDGDIPTNRLYTGQRQDEAGLYFYNARWYDSQLGRFIQPDTIVPNPYNPIDLDRYAYVRNNPINMNDPTGHDVGCPASNPACAKINGYPYDPRYEEYLEKVRVERERMRSLEGEAGIPPILSRADSYWPGLPPKGSYDTSPRTTSSTIGPSSPTSISANPEPPKLNVSVNVDWDRVDHVDLLVDSIGLIGDVSAIVGFPEGLVPFAVTEIVEGAGFVKSGIEFVNGDPSSLLLQQTTEQGQRVAVMFWRAERLVPIIGSIGNGVSLWVNLQPNVKIEYK